MTEGEIMNQIGNASVERKKCLDVASCYEERLKKALYHLRVFLDEDRDPFHEDNQGILHLDSDLRIDAKGYLEAMDRANELTEFLKKHNAF